MKLIVFIFCICTHQVSAQKSIGLSSPDGNLTFTFKIHQSTPQYSVSFKGKSLIDYASLRLIFDFGELKNIKLNKPIYRDTTEEYDLVHGKASHIKTRYKEITLPLEESNGLKRKINLVIRAFNDGLAFRYVFPGQANWSQYNLIDESSSFKLTGNPMVRTLFRENYTTSHEGYYDYLPWAEVNQDSLMDIPTLIEYPGPVYMGITEAALLDYAGMYLVKHLDTLVSKLSPLPGKNGLKVKAVLPHRTPWRVLLISDRIGTLIESNIVTSLNDPCVLNDVSWIKPGKTTFPWWNGNVTPDTLNAPGNNFVTNQYYIDFCARNQIEYHSVVEYGLHQWYVDDGVNFQPGPNADPTTPVPGLNMKRICDYAKSVGVGTRIWVQWAALYPKLDSAFALYERWGLAGMMVDFMDRDDQEMVNIQTEILQKAAKHKLHIQWHGAYKPTGIQRTYPNEFTKEAVLNYEYNKWTKGGLNTDHDINIPFTRMLAGATDYHLGGFRAGNFNTPHYTRPILRGTRAHLLAMYIVLESSLQMVADHPAAYEGEPGWDFLQVVPTTWDETKVIDAVPGEYITIARRKNTSWYIATITNQKSREVTVPLGFLREGMHNALLYTDAEDVSDNANHINKEIRSVSNQDILSLKIASGGGMVIKID